MRRIWAKRGLTSTEEKGQSSINNRQSKDSKDETPIQSIQSKDSKDETPSILWTMGNISSNTDERKRLSVEATGDRGDDNLALLLDILGAGEANSVNNNAPLGVNEFTDLLLSCGARDSLTLDRSRRLATNKSAEAEESAVGLIDLFDEVIADIAHYLLPPDVYNLCLTSKRFHRPTTLPTSPDYLELGGNAPGALLSTRLLRISLLDR